MRLQTASKLDLPLPQPHHKAVRVQCVSVALPCVRIAVLGG